MDKLKSSFAIKALVTGIFLNSCATQAATPIDLNHQKAIKNSQELVEIKRQLDEKQTLHVRYKQTYQGHTVWGAESIVHISKGKSLLATKNILKHQNQMSSMDGTLYQNIEADLKGTPAYIFDPSRAQEALKNQIESYESKIKGPATETKSELMVYVDKANKAHWAFLVTFYIPPTTENEIPERPVAIVDASNFQVYEQWSNIQTAKKLADVLGGGYGGNPKVGRLTYDGLPGDLPYFNITRNYSRVCFMMGSKMAAVYYMANSVVTYGCNLPDPQHNNIYWSANFDTTNDGYSPANDVMYAGKALVQMYQDWYNLFPIVSSSGSPITLLMMIHGKFDSSFYDGQKMYFGDGLTKFYPLTSPDIVAHEITHGFTAQHAKLTYKGQSGAINESFSDMAAAAFEFYLSANNNWQIGQDVLKDDGAWRYMDKPSRDCNDNAPGTNCSIDNISQYTDNLDIHYGSGVFNRAFYFLSTSDGWDAKKAFDVMMRANQYYWTSATNFEQGACGVIKAAKDLNYNVIDVKASFLRVGIEYCGC